MTFREEEQNKQKHMQRSITHNVVGRVSLDESLCKFWLQNL